MKTTSLIIFEVVTLSIVLSTQAQGTFQNLNFEQANPSPNAPGLVTSASALPDWAVSVGGIPQTQINYNDPSTGAPAVTLISTSYPFGGGLAPIDGTYSVLLQGSGVPSAPSISQTGRIPTLTQSLFFEAEPEQGNPAGPLEVMIGSQIVPFTAVGTGPNYTLYNANISAWAGDTEQLTFSAPEYVSQNNWLIDDISFSNVPEPSVVALNAMGGLLFGARKWLARRR
jgi:hypothetical protein